MYYRNSDFKVNRYFYQFKDDIKEASKHGKDVLYNEMRKKNNCYHARKLQGDISLKDIFYNNWPKFKELYKDRLTRKGLIESVDKFVSCHNFDNGYLYFECPNCKDFYVMGFSCHSRACPSCGEKYRDQRTCKVSEKCLEIPHRQFVFTVPEQLRIYFRYDRKPLLNILFKSVDDAFNLLLSTKAPKKYKEEKRRLGYIAFLHTFGRDMKWHPHIHVLIAERYLNNTNQLVKYDYFSFEFLRKTFRNVLFKRIYDYYKTHKDKNQLRKMCLLQKQLMKKYEKGYYVYGKKFSKDKSTTKDIILLTNYIARYASHPPISERRIISYDPLTNLVTWFYDPHEDDDINDEEEKIGRQYITEDAFSFMERILLHIPDKGFQQIRYYGFYSNKFKNKVDNNLLFSKNQINNMYRATMWVDGLLKAFGYNPILCKCGTQMELNYELSYFNMRKDYS